MSAIWPSAGVSPEVKQLIKHFFSLVDLPKTDAGLRMAAEVFTEDGVFAATSGYFKGKGMISTSGNFRRLAEEFPKFRSFAEKTDIEKCRETAWTTVRARHHEVEKVYLNDAEGLQLVITGVVIVKGVDKTPETHEFVAWALLVGSQSENPRIKHYQVLIPSPKR